MKLKALARRALTAVLPKTTRADVFKEVLVGDNVTVARRASSGSWNGTARRSKTSRSGTAVGFRATATDTRARSAICAARLARSDRDGTLRIRNTKVRSEAVGQDEATNEEATQAEGDAAHELS